MFDWLINYVKDNCWTILIVGALIVILICWLFKGNSKGTWDNSFYYDDRKPMGQHIRAAGESKGEAECRYVLETIFNQKFPKRRPKFLFNSQTGSNMELDMYNKEIGVACEYNGKQHYVYTPYFHRGGEKDFTAQQQRDDEKRRVCKKLGIFLIEVPYTVPLSDIRAFITKKLRENGLLRK
jgi:hypothetical protein